MVVMIDGVGCTQVCGFGNHLFSVAPPNPAPGCSADLLIVALCGHGVPTLVILVWWSTLLAACEFEVWYLR